MTTKQEEAVTRGEAFLDEHFPGQLDTVDLKLLQMEDCVFCVLGQSLHIPRGQGNIYWDFVAEYEEETGSRRDIWQKDHGFVPVDGTNGDWAGLELLWRDRIRARQELLGTKTLG